MLRTRVIYNPSAGMRTARGELERALDVLRERDWEIELVETAHSNDAMRIAHEAADAKLDALISVGGDGTMNEVVNGLVGSSTALGILPMGTGNVWAKEMGLVPGDLLESARRLREAQVRLIDVGEVTGRKIAPRVFVLWCGVGLDAAVTRSVEPQREMKRRFGALYFWLMGVREAWSFRGKRALLLFDGRRVRQRAILALASNAQLYGGVTRVAPSARLDDGRLDLVVLKGRGLWTTAAHVLRVLLGMHVRDPQVDFYSVRSVFVHARKMPVHVDGEPIGFAPVEIRVRPRALRVLVPQTANQTLFSANSQST